MSHHQFAPPVLPKYDIRGIIGETLGPEDARPIGRVFGLMLREVGDCRVAVGYDGQVSSPIVEHALVEVLNASGCHVARIGMAATLMLYYAEFSVEGIDSGIEVTGGRWCKMSLGSDCNLVSRTIKGARKFVVEAQSPLIFKGFSTALAISRCRELVEMLLRSYMLLSGLSLLLSNKN
jgi:hypothetical protein|tara:strand:- start:5271 stop:5804 length:534 start_codon:yes stop_codon:yes gene_type:complete